MPGVSYKYSPSSKRILCCPFVTAGSLPTLALALPTNVLSKVDLPTFGIPIITALICLPASSLFGANFLIKFGRVLATDGDSVVKAIALTLCWDSK